MKESTFLNKHKRKLNIAIQQSYNISNVNRVLGDSIDVAQYIAEGIPIFRIIECAIDLLDKGITKLENSNREYDSTYRKFIVELEKREQHISPEAIKEYLPTLFAMDISNWLKKKNFYLVIFLDTYEQLTDDEKDTKPHEKLIYEERDVPVDWWIERLIFNTLERVLWVIAGRSKIEKIGENIELYEEEHLFTLKSLKEKFADEFLLKAGIEDKNLREGIIELTGGYPIFLSLCVDTYNLAIRQNGTAPTLDKFDGKREDVIKRLLEFMDDGTRNMVKRLCILGKWTELFATRVLKSFNELNYDTYNRVKKLSFVTEKSGNILVFDRSVREILFTYLMENEPVFVTAIIQAVNNFFENAFHKVDDDENKSITNEDRNLFFKLWAEFILSTTDDAADWMKQYDEKLAPISVNFDDDVVESVIVQFKNKIENTVGKEKLTYAYFEHLFAQIKFAEGNDFYALELAKISYDKIAKPNIKKSTDYMTAGHYSMALYHAVNLAETADEYETFVKNFKLAINNMFYSKKEIVLKNYGRILKYLLDVYRKNDEVILLIDKTMKFIDDCQECFGKCLNEFVVDLKLYKLTALSHSGKIEEFQRIATECQSDIEKAFETGKNRELYFEYNNRRIVNFQDVFNYVEGLKLGGEITSKIKSFLDKKDPNFSIYKYQNYKYQYCCICGSLATTCYLTLNNSHENLELARKYSDITINGFARTDDKMRSYQTRAQIEAEAGNFDKACKMLDKGINISFKNPQAEQFKNFDKWYWYHFAKFSERLLKSSNKKYFEIAKHAVEIAREEFLNYRNEIGDVPKYPAYITFSKMATCFDIVGDTELAMKLHETALRGVDADNGDDTAAFKLVMTANKLRTLEKNNFKDQSEILTEKLKKDFYDYLKQVKISSMKVPFDGWQELLDKLEKDSSEKFTAIEKMSRSILFS